MSSFALTLLNLFNRLSDIGMDRTIEDTSPAAHAGDPTDVFWKVVKLVHDSLPGPLPVRWPRVMT